MEYDAMVENRIKTALFAVEALPAELGLASIKEQLEETLAKYQEGRF